jgi:uncharacterized protein (TIGR02466 family)
MSIWNLFSTPIYINTTDGESFKKIQKELKNIISLIKSNDNFIGSHDLNSEFFDPLNTKINENILTSKILKYYNCLDLMNKISENTTEYLKNIGITDGIQLEITNSWMTCSTKGYHTQVHHHESSDISGIYYYNTNGVDGNLYFRSPTKYMEISKIFKYSSNEYSTQDFQITPVTGMMILFPSWLDHGVRTNVTDSERISISFNIKSL